MVVMETARPWWRLTLLEAVYVLAVGGFSAWGWFVSGTPLPILVAAGLALPTSIAALVAFYLSYGLLSWVFPDSDVNSGGASSSSGAQTTYDFSATMLVADSLGVLLLMAAAVVNVVLLRQLSARRRATA